MVPFGMQHFDRRFPVLWFVCFCLGLFLTGVALAQERRVTNPEALQNALAEDVGGTIVLAAGEYGVLEITKPFGKPVVLRSERLHGARFEVVRLSGTSQITLDGLRLRKGLAIKLGSQDITARNNMITGTLYVRDVSRLVLSDNEVTNGPFGILLNSVATFQVRRNHVHGAAEDLMRITGSSSQGIVEYNVIQDTTAGRPIHPDVMQFFAAQGVTPRDIVIRRNLLYDIRKPGETMAQGIFLSDPAKQGYKNILVEENLIRVASPNSIYVNGGIHNVTVRNNSLMAAGSGGAGGGGAVIRLVGKAKLGNTGTLVEGNVAKQLLDETKQSRIGRNFLYGRDAPLAQMFSGPSGGARWEDFLPVLGSELDQSGMGARAFLDELQAERGKPPGQRRVYLGPSWALK